MEESKTTNLYYCFSCQTKGTTKQCSCHPDSSADLIAKGRHSLKQAKRVISSHYRKRGYENPCIFHVEPFPTKRFIILLVNGVEDRGDVIEYDSAGIAIEERFSQGYNSSDQEWLFTDGQFRILADQHISLKKKPWRYYSHYFTLLEVVNFSWLITYHIDYWYGAYSSEPYKNFHAEIFQTQEKINCNEKVWDSIIPLKADFNEATIETVLSEFTQPSFQEQFTNQWFNADQILPKGIYDTTQSSFVFPPHKILGVTRVLYSLI